MIFAFDSGGSYNSFVVNENHEEKEQKSFRQTIVRFSSFFKNSTSSQPNYNSNRG